MLILEKNYPPNQCFKLLLHGVRKTKEHVVIKLSWKKETIKTNVGIIEIDNRQKKKNREKQQDQELVHWKIQHNY